MRPYTNDVTAPEEKGVALENRKYSEKFGSVLTYFACCDGGWVLKIHKKTRDVIGACSHKTSRSKGYGVYNKTLQT